MLSRTRDVAIESVLVVVGSIVLGYFITVLGFWSLPVVAVAALGLAALYRPATALAVLVFLLPLTAIEGDSMGYNTVIQDFKKFATTGVLCAWLLHVIIRRRRLDIPRNVWIPLSVLGFAATLSVLRAPEPGVAITSSARLLLYASVFLVAVIDLTREPRDVWRLLRLQFISASIACVFAIYQFAAHFVGWRTFLNPLYETVYLLPRVHSFMQEPLWFSNYLLSVFPVACAIYCWRHGRWSVLVGITAILAAVSLILAASRLGWACAVLTTVLFLIASRSYTKPSRVSLLAASGILALIIAGTMWARSFGSLGEMGRYVRDFATFASVEGGEGDLEGRLRLLPLVAEGLRSSPVIGIGTNNVGFRFHRAMNLDEARISSTHNTYLDVFLETGGLGVLSLGLLIIGTLRAAWLAFRHFRGAPEGAVSLGLGLAVLALAFHLTNWSGWREAHVWYVLGITIAASRAFTQSASSDARTTMKADRSNRTAQGGAPVFPALPE